MLTARENDSIIERTRKARVDAGYKSQAAMALALGIEITTYPKYETRTPIPQNLIPQFCALTKVSPQWLLTGHEEYSGMITLPGKIAVVGEVQAGVWKEAFQWDEQELFYVAVPLSDKHEKTAYGLVVRGDSMNKIYNDGDILIVVPLDSYDKDLRSGVRVVVERRKKDGIVEATAKELIITNGAAELWPRSHNPRLQKPILLHWPHFKPEKIETDTVEIKGIIIGSYREEKI
jgi:repressor LexA